jgi:cellulose synthase/poly-beta-1,6-N-acetylglucosamine synthase-like glycosyltransferase
LSFHDVKRKVISRGYEDLDIALESYFTPPLSIIVPAYNEEKTIVESVRSLINLKFPLIEIVIVNDGSNDTTVEVIKRVFNMKRIDIDYLERITTAPIKGYYESKQELPGHIHRFILIDKENGGKADAINAGINTSHCPYFVSIDSDSVLDELALLQTFRMILDNEDIVAIGGQVAVLNGCDVRDGRVVKTKMPKSRLARFQIVEYIRAFTMSRTAFTRLNSLLIISGAFGIFQKELVYKIGGYLTKHITSKIACEYTTPKAETVCEDMEIIVRMHRYIKEKKLDKKIAYVPHPLCWTEVPEDLQSLSKQRNRWQRGLIETMLYHRRMLFNRKYGRIGLFAFPYFLLFELLAAPIEFLGYITLPFLFFLDNLNYSYLLMFLMISVVYGTSLSVFSVAISAWPEKTAETDFSGKSLIYFKEIRELVILFLYGVLENFGYRQLTAWWRMKGIIDLFRGKKGWDKFERKGFDNNKEGSGDDALVTH